MGHENGFINLKFDVKPDRYNYYLRKDTYYEFQQLGLQKITVYLKSETEKEINVEINESTFDTGLYVWFDRDWRNDDFGISFHFKIPNQHYSLLKKLNVDFLK